MLVSYRQVLLLQVCATFADNAAKERLDDVVNVLSFYFFCYLLVKYYWRI